MLLVLLVLALQGVVAGFRMYEANHFINLTFVDPTNMQTNTVNGYIELAVDQYKEAKMVCDILVPSTSQKSPESDNNHYHAICMHNMIRSLRWRLFDFVSNTTHGRQRSPYANSIYASLFAYEFPLSVETVSRKACLLGNVEAHRLLPAILSSHIDTIDVFVIPEDMTNFQVTQGVSSEEVDYIISFAQMMKKAINVIPVYAIDDILRGEPEVLASVPRYQCDIIDISPTFLAFGDELDMFLPLLVKEESTRLLRSVVFTTEEEVAEFGDVAHAEWFLSSTWPWFSSFFVQPDSNGFAAWSYLFSGDNVKLSKVQLGVWTPLQSGLNDQHVCHDSQLVVQSSSDHQEASMKDRIVIVITYTIRVFFDNAFGLQTALRRLGYSRVYVPEDFNFTVAQQLKQEAQAKKGWLLQIALGPHDIGMLTEHYVAFHMEQVWSIVTFSLQHDRYLIVLQNAISVWTFSYHIADSLTLKGLGPVHTLPMYTKSSIIPWKASSNKEGKECHVVFFGSGSRRRIAAIQQLHHETESDNIGWTAHCGSWNTTTLDAERDVLMGHTDIVLNIHTDDQSVLEVHRINYLLSMGKLVISERGADPRLSTLYEDAVVFVDHWTEMAPQIRHYCQQERDRIALEEKAMRRFDEIHNTLEPLRIAMLEIEESFTSRESC